jgi:hypothetical protein
MTTTRQQRLAERDAIIDRRIAQSVEAGAADCLLTYPATTPATDECPRCRGPVGSHRPVDAETSVHDRTARA